MSNILLNNWYIFSFVIFLFTMNVSALEWNSEQLEVFDLVEDINKNFYDLMEITQDASMSDVKKAYRTLSRKLHPDKNDAPDAEIRFREMVAVYEVLRDEKKRECYDKVLVDGLPDWRSPIFYYRRARKLSLLESSLILVVVVSITQYLMAWGTYLDQWKTMEEYLCKKYRIKDRKRQRNEDIENRNLMEKELQLIPKPRCWNVLPVQVVKFVFWLTTNGPSIAIEMVESVRESWRRREEKRRAEELETRRMKEEEERRIEKKSQNKQRKKVQTVPDYTGRAKVASTSRDAAAKVVSAVPVIVGGPWTDEDFSNLAKLMGKFPGGTPERWEKIAESMNRTVFEVTKMSSKVLDSLNSKVSEEEEAARAKVKVKTKGAALDEGEAASSEPHAGSDEVWSSVQQRALEKALKQFPKGVDQRWEKISRAVPEKTKEDCMLRFKYLAERIKKRKEEEEEEREGGQEAVCPLEVCPPEADPPTSTLVCENEGAVAAS